MPPDNDTPEREKQVVELLRAAAARERAPDALHARVATMRDEAAAPPRRRLLPWPAFRLARLALPTSAAGIAAVLVIALGGGASAPTIAQAAALAARGPTTAAPASDPAAPATLLAARVGDLRFPNWETSGGWRSTGQRHDSAGDRMVTTVFYAHGRQRVAYSIVAAPALARANRQSEPYATLTQDGRTVIVWEERNHTCVLSATGIAAPRLWRLAISGSTG